MAERLNNQLINLRTSIDRRNINLPQISDLGGNSITIDKPVNSVNYPTKPTNDSGLNTNTRTTDRQTIRNRPILERIEDGTLDEQTIDVSNKAIDLVINVVDEFYVDVPDIQKISYPKEVRGADFIGFDVNFDVKFDTINTDYVKIGIGNTSTAYQTSDNFIKLNIKEIVFNYIDDIDRNSDKISIPIYLTPYRNKSSREIAADELDTGANVSGETETITVLFDRGDLVIPREVALNRLAEGFISQFDNCEFDISNYLTHLLHLGDGNNKVITSWVGSEDSLILKLYEPLPTNVQPNDKVWITKIQSEPIIETITLVGDDIDYCPPLQGPNFSLESDNGIGYQIYDDLLAKGHSTNTALVQDYISKKGINTEKLNIEYASNTEYYFNNFVHFGSAEERIKNFLYKIQLLEKYQSEFNTLSTSTVELGNILTDEGFVLITEDGNPLQLDGTTINAITNIEANKRLDNINSLIGTFDGFEKYLYTSNDELAYPKNNNVLLPSTDNDVISWYNSAINSASNYDRNNVNYLNNNLPEFIKEDYDNEDFMLFMDMIAHHFDIIWAYIRTLTKIKQTNHKSDKGISNELIYHMLESLGWNGQKAFDSQFLWEYALGQYKDGTQKYQQSLKSANEEVWNRIINNLPYLLKHKGTSRSLKAVMACYGVPQSLLTIMEFGGPVDPTKGGTKPFTFEDRTSALIFEGSQYIDVDWKSLSVSNSINPNLSTTPQSVEMTVKFDKSTNHSLANSISDSTTNWSLDAIQTTGSYGFVKLNVSGSSGNVELETSQYELFNDTYKTIVVTREVVNPLTSSFNLHIKESIEDRLRINDNSELTITGSTNWDTTGSLLVGSSSFITLDEFRLWNTPLEEGVITSHTKMPDSITGNTYSSSTEDLWVRFDFEFPKNRAVDTDILNVAISNEYQNPTSSLVGFTNIENYPYNHTVYDRTVTAQVPSLGFNQSDKIRFETQTLVGDLSHKVRATTKSFDRAPIDSSRLGLFFSPMKELNMDIIRSIGDFNIDNYIGNPADEYNDSYTELADLRKYYFERLDRNIYEYIRLVKYIDKSLFDILEDLSPARAKVSKGLLIEPHYLERSKVKWNKAQSERGDYDVDINIDDDIEVIGTNNQYIANVDAESDIELSHQFDNYDTTLTVDDITELQGTTPFYHSNIEVDDAIELKSNYPTYNTEIQVPNGTKVDAIVDTTSFTQVGMEADSLSNLGFGLYTPLPGTGSVTNIDIFGNETRIREQIYLIKEQYIERVKVQISGYPTTSNDEPVEFEVQDIPKFRYKISKIPVGKALPTVGGNVVEVSPLNGYFSSHYRNTANLSAGLENSYFKGSKQTEKSTPDGLSPVETFTTNPNILKVADTGRGSGEPILNVK